MRLDTWTKEDNMNDTLDNEDFSNYDFIKQASGSHLNTEGEDNDTERGNDASF